MDIESKVFSLNGHGLRSHTWAAQSQCKNKCFKDSGDFPHKWHSIDGRVNLLFRIEAVGRISQANFHSKFLSLAWIFIFHNTFQSILCITRWEIEEGVLIPYKPISQKIHLRDSSTKKLDHWLIVERGECWGFYRSSCNCRFSSEVYSTIQALIQLKGWQRILIDVTWLWLTQNLTWMLRIKIIKSYNMCEREIFKILI